MSNFLLRSQFPVMRNAFFPVLFKLSFCDSALTRSKPKLKDLVEEDFRRKKKENFEKHFVEKLFLDKFQEDVLEYPQLDSEEDLLALRNHFDAAQKLITDKSDDEQTSSKDYPAEAISIVKKHELSGFKLPKFSSGFGYLSSEYTFIQEALGLNPSLVKTICEHEDFGIQLIHTFGNDTQKGQYLTKLLSGEITASFAHVEPSKLISLENDSLNTVAVASSDNQSFRISGKKTWVYNAQHADLFILSANIINSNGEKIPRTTLFLIDKKTPGIEILQPTEKIGLKKLSVCDITFNKMLVPSSCILGNINEGGEIVGSILSKGKFNNGGQCIAIMKKLVHKAIHHCIHNEFFEKDKCEVLLFRHKIAQMVLQIYSVESMTYLMTGRFDMHDNADVFLESLIVKIYASDSLLFLTQQALEILGPEFFSDDEDLVQLSRDSLFYLACDDANDYLKILLSSTGLKYMRDLKEKRPIGERFLELFGNHYFKQLQYGRESYVGSKKILKGYVHEMFSSESILLEDCVHCLSICAKHLLRNFEGDMYERHLKLKLLADIVVNIYVSASTLARASRAYCLGLKLHEIDRLCGETVAKICNMRVRKNRNFILNDRSASYTQIAPKIIASNKYSDFMSVAKIMNIRKSKKNRDVSV